MELGLYRLLRGDWVIHTNGNLLEHTLVLPSIGNTKCWYPVPTHFPTVLWLYVIKHKSVINVLTLTHIQIMGGLVGVYGNKVWMFLYISNSIIRYRLEHFLHGTLLWQVIEVLYTQEHQPHVIVHTRHPIEHHRVVVLHVHCRLNTLIELLRG